MTTWKLVRDPLKEWPDNTTFPELNILKAWRCFRSGSILEDAETGKQYSVTPDGLMPRNRHYRLYYKAGAE